MLCKLQQTHSLAISVNFIDVWRRKMKEKKYIFLDANHRLLLFGIASVGRRVTAKNNYKRDVACVVRTSKLHTHTQTHPRTQ